MELKKIRHELVEADSRGILHYKKYMFEKAIINRDRQREIINEVPVTEFAYLISVRKNSVWLTPQQLFDLKEMLADEEELQSSSKATTEVMQYAN